MQTTFGAADASVRLASPGWARPLGNPGSPGIRTVRSAPCQTWASEAQVSVRPAVQRRGVERRRLILETAEALLGEQGYESATLRAIGERAGIPAASVHHYFSDRPQIDSLLAQRHAHELEALVDASLSVLCHPIEAFDNEPSRFGSFDSEPSRAG
ncbi:TetR/AcrR family transcriptional regulator [Streptomyces sp. NPDC001817]|uniref:TetR/AcrR family transcriptional regulator n=1 Tax=Streptomyces sp. NPDC001817 TaxID=3154398 RepID=UPI00331BAD57